MGVVGHVAKYFGMSFLSYYTNVRLQHAVADLLGSDESIENIALDNGFPDPRAFVSAFRKKYGVQPSVYRKQALARSADAARQEKLHSDYLYTLAKYLPQRRELKDENTIPVSQNFSEEIIDLSGDLSRTSSKSSSFALPTQVILRKLCER